ncbi:MAG: hypothetical protein KBD46_03655 [Candidatus Levybacteria bacterium]|nr:hypothetical protein [Candidatus Levybacteria bacterium]
MRQLPRGLESFVVALVCAGISLRFNNWFVIGITAGIVVLYMSYHGGRLFKEEYFSAYRLGSPLAVGLTVFVTYSWLVQSGHLWVTLMLVVLLTDFVVDEGLKAWGKLPATTAVETEAVPAHG